MDPRRLSVRCVPFDPTSLPELVAEACGANWRDGPPVQVAYLASYLAQSDCHAHTVVVEEPYVDRHFLEEYAAYYATVLRPPRRDSVRLHFFDIEFDDLGLSQRLEAAHAGEYEAIRGELDAAYIGFTAVRPIPAAPIGRTILRPYGNVKSRSLDRTTANHRVHLLGLELAVPAVPFQQQERGVGACATAAVWAALASASRAAGGRTPTPFTVTEAATRHTVQNRVLPAAAGLGIAQVCDAVREVGFEPYVVKADREAKIFSVILKLYLRSGVPAILLISTEGQGGFDHAVAAVGYREDDDDEWAAPLEATVAPDLPPLQSSGLSRVYVHDDRLGPYARMKWALPAASGESPTLSYIPYDATLDFPTTNQGVYAAIYPVYPKLRLSGRGLLELAGDEILQAFRELHRAGEKSTVRVDPWFELGGSYLRSLLLDEEVPFDSVKQFVTSLALPRFVGVLRFFVEELRICDVVYDTTDIRRDTPRFGSLLAVLAYRKDYREFFEELMEAESADWVVVG